MKARPRHFKVTPQKAACGVRSGRGGVVLFYTPGGFYVSCKRCLAWLKKRAQVVGTYALLNEVVKKAARK